MVVLEVFGAAEVGAMLPSGNGTRSERATLLLSIVKWDWSPNEPLLRDDEPGARAASATLAEISERDRDRTATIIKVIEHRRPSVLHRWRNIVTWWEIGPTRR